MKISVRPFGILSTGETIDQIILENSDTEIHVLNYGAIIQKFIKKTDDVTVDIVLGMDTLAEYEHNPCYFGAVIGRVAGRIGQGEFSLNGKHYTLDKNEKNRNHLHGGHLGLSKQVYTFETKQTENSVAVTLCVKSLERDTRYPGDVDFEVTYSLTEAGQFKLVYLAKPSCETPLSLTNHSYFNLSNISGEETVHDHTVMILSKHYLPMDKFMIPTGEIRPVIDSAFDLNEPKNIRQHYEDFSEALEATKGLDHAFVLDTKQQGKPQICLTSPLTKLVLEITSSEPVVVCYGGGFLDESVHEKNGKKSKSHRGICFETQQYPNAVNCAAFKSTLFSPDRPYRQETEWIVKKI